MDRGAWWATVHGVAEVLDTTESINCSDWAPTCVPWLLILCSSLFQHFPPNTSNSALYFYSFFSSSFNPSSFRPANLYSSFKAQSHITRALWCPSHPHFALGEPAVPSPHLLWAYLSYHTSPSQTAVAVHSLSRGRLFAAPWTAAPQALLASTVSWSFLRLMSMEMVMPSWNF